MATLRSCAQKKGLAGRLPLWRGVAGPPLIIIDMTMIMVVIMVIMVIMVMIMVMLYDDEIQTRDAS